MTDQPMTPREAADAAVIERALRLVVEVKDPGHPASSFVVHDGGDGAEEVFPITLAERIARSLIRATSPAPEGGDRPLCRDPECECVDRCAVIGDRLAPAPSVATPPQEGGEPCDECTCQTWCARYPGALAAPPAEGGGA